MKRSTSERLRRFYELFSGSDHALILIHADPDAIASAMAVKRLLWRKTAGVTISNINIIKRPDNLSMIRLLGVKLTYIEDIPEEHPYTKVVMVDSQPDHSDEFSRFDITAIIDHHPRTDASAPFMDIRPEYGSNAAIMTEYLRAAKIKPSVKLATGLYHAIKTDTCNFERQAQIEDVRAFQFLFKHANTTLARKIEHADIRLDFLKYFRTAIEAMRMNRSRVFVHLGPVINPDVCVLIADFFMRVNPVTWSIVSGLYEGRLILIFRNDGIRQNAGTVAKKSFGRYGSAGGHKSMARGELPVEALEGVVDLTDDSQVLRWIIREMEKKAPPSSCKREAENDHPPTYS